MLAKLLDKAMQDRGLRSYRSVAKEIGVSHTTIGRILNGKIPDSATLLLISAWLELPPSVLMDIEADDDVSKIKVLVDRYPELGNVFRDALKLIEDKKAGPELIGELVAYASFRIAQIKGD